MQGKACALQDCSDRADEGDRENNMIKEFSRQALVLCVMACYGSLLLCIKIFIMIINFRLLRLNISMKTIKNCNILFI